jgi:beta-xylosidase
VGRRRRVRLARTVAVTVGVGALAAALVTDVGAHTRNRQERQALVTATRALKKSQFDVGATTYARGLASGRLKGLQTSISTMVGDLAATQGVISNTNKAAYIQGLDLGILHTCLGGVGAAYQSIAAQNTNAATQEISAVSGSCLALDNGAGGGIVYPFDFPDPFVLRVGGTYFAYATNSAEGNIQIISSTDLSHWTAVGNALPRLPRWAAPNATWAPSVRQMGGTFVLYYSAVVAGPGGGEQCISAATATRPQGPFTDSSTLPLECQSSLGGSIDPFSFVDASGVSYLVWKSNGGSGQPATIWSQALNAAGTGLAGAGPSRLLGPTLPWEAGVVEAPDMVLEGGHYFLFFSGNNWNSSAYAVGMATCSGPLGPCALSTSQPILASDSGTAGPGGESVFADSSGQWWMAFDAWVPGAVAYPNSRALYLRRLTFSGSTAAIAASG